MQATRIYIEGNSFLLPLSHADNYEFPSYIAEHKSDISRCVEAYKGWAKDPLDDMPPTPDMTEFKEKTGIIGAPFNLHNVDLYIIDRNVDVVLEVTL